MTKKSDFKAVYLSRYSKKQKPGINSDSYCIKILDFIAVICHAIVKKLDHET